MVVMNAYVSNVVAAEVVEINAVPLDTALGL